MVLRIPTRFTEEMIKQYEDFKKRMKMARQAVNKSGAELIAEERLEQIEKHGYTVESDQKYTDKQLLALAFFCIFAADKEGEFTSVALKADMIKEWGFEAEFFDKISSKTAIEKLAIAGAFIAAEIDRINASEKTDDAPIK